MFEYWNDFLNNKETFISTSIILLIMVFVVLFVLFTEVKNCAIKIAEIEKKIKGE